MYWGDEQEQALIRLAYAASQAGDFEKEILRSKLASFRSIRSTLLLQQWRQSSMPQLFQVRRMYRISGYIMQLDRIEGKDMVFCCPYWDDELFARHSYFTYKGSLFKVRLRYTYAQPGRKGRQHVCFEIHVRPYKGKTHSYLKSA